MSTRARRTAPVVAVLVVLATVCGVTWGVWGDGSRFAEAMQTADPTPRLPYVVDTYVLVKLPGRTLFDEEGPLDEFTDRDVLTPSEVKIVEEGPVAEVEGTIKIEKGVTLGLWRFSVREGESPWELYDGLDGLYRLGNHLAVDTTHPNVSLRRNENTFHAHYVHGQDVLRVEGYGDNGDAVADQIMKLLDRQVERSPADERPS